mgnify:FL=1
MTKGNDWIKEHYDRSAANSKGRNYEFARWMETPLKQAGFWMEKTVLNRLFKKIPQPKNFIEYGPGPGTWTKMILKSFPEIKGTLVDISTEMLLQAQASLEKEWSGRYELAQGDMATYVPRRQYDFLFSSRAIEYVEDIRPVTRTFSKSLKSGGYGIVITKMPHKRSAVIGKKGAIHKMMIEPKTLVYNLRVNGCDVLGVYPVSVVFPGLRSAVLNVVLFKVIRIFPYFKIFYPISESYAVLFRKL